MTPRIASASVLLCALLPRLYVAIAWAREPVWDGHYYDIGARSIASGLGYVGVSGGAWCHYPVGYSAVLGGAYAAFGPGRFTGPIMNAVIGALLAVATYHLARHATTERRALFAGLIVALYPGLIAYTPLLMTEPAAALAIIGAALIAATHAKRRAGWVAAAVVLGLGILIRPQSALCAPLLALFAFKGQGMLALGRRALAVAAVALAVVLPWTARNCLVMDGCALVSTNGGWNLAIGASPRATGRFSTLRGSDGCRIVTGQVQQDRCWMDAGMAWIANDPRRWIGLMDDKLGHTFDHESFAIGYLGEADPQAWPEPRRALGRGVLSWTHRALLSLAACGVIAAPRRARPATLLVLLTVVLLAFAATVTPSHPYWLLALWIPLFAGLRHAKLSPTHLYAAGSVATVALTHAVFFGEDRYHMVVTPMLAILAASAFGNDEPAAKPA